jgi:hypothetical protein
LDAAHATAKQPTHEEGTPLSLADTINGIWAETTHPRLRQPTTPQTLPHIYSIIEELLGHTKEIADAEPLAMKPWSERTQNGSASGTSQSLAK